MVQLLISMGKELAADNMGQTERFLLGMVGFMVFLLGGATLVGVVETIELWTQAEPAKLSEYLGNILGLTAMTTVWIVLMIIGYGYVSERRSEAGE